MAACGRDFEVAGRVLEWGEVEGLGLGRMGVMDARDWTPDEEAAFELGLDRRGSLPSCLCLLNRTGIGYQKL